MKLTGLARGPIVEPRPKRSAIHIPLAGSPIATPTSEASGGRQPKKIIMPKFRKKPVEIEARQFVTNNEAGDVNMNDIVRWVNAGGSDASHNGTDIFIHTREGKMTANCGDWIIRGVAGEFYPCKPDIFQATYDPA